MKALKFLIVAAAGLSLTSCASSPKTLGNSSDEVAQLYTEMGTAALQRSDYPQAVHDLREALNRNDDIAIAHNHLGLAYIGLGKMIEAKREIKKALSIDPAYSDAHINLGVLAEGEGKFSEARAEYRAALDNLEYQFRHRAMTNLAQLALRENKIDEARNLLYQSLQVNPDYCLTHFLLGSIYQRETNHPRAAEEFRKSVSGTCTTNVQGHYALGLSYLKLKDYKKARSEFVYLMEHHPDSTHARMAGDQLRNIP